MFLIIYTNKMCEVIKLVFGRYYWLKSSVVLVAPYKVPGSSHIYFVMILIPVVSIFVLHELHPDLLIIYRQQYSL